MRFYTLSKPLENDKKKGIGFDYKIYDENQNEEFRRYIEDMNDSISNNTDNLPGSRGQSHGMTVDGIAKNASRLTLVNSCRGTAIDILSHVLQDQSIGNVVSRNPLSKLPFQTFVCDGQLDFESFYILPFPPKCYTDIPAAHKDAVDFLYQRLDEFTRYSTDSLVVKREFDALKVLYEALISPGQEKKINIWNNWREKYSALVDRCRSWRWFEWRTPLQVMFHTIEKSVLGDNTTAPVHTAAAPIQSKEELARIFYEVPKLETGFSSDQNTILKTLHNQMQTVMQTWSDCFITQKKFNLIKKLYTTLVDEYKKNNKDKKEAVLHLDKIQNVEKNYRGYIDEPRGRWSLFSYQTSTRKMLNGIHAQFGYYKPTSEGQTPDPVVPAKI